MSEKQFFKSNDNPEIAKEIEKNLKVYVYSGGCSSDNLDLQRIEDYARINHYPIVYKPDDADIIFVGTCTLTQNKEDVTINKIKELKNIKPEAKIIPVGCLVKQNPKRMDEIHKGESLSTKTNLDWDRLNKILPGETFISEINDPVLIRPHIDWRIIEEYDAFPILKQRLEKLSPEEKNGILENIATAKSLDYKKISDLYHRGGLNEDEFKELEGYDEQAAILRIAKGCEGECTYCAINRARGHLVSIKPEIILQKFKGALNEGIRSFKLWADDIGAYGKDINTNLADLLEDMLKENKDFELEVLAGNPNDFLEIYDKLFPLLKDPRIKYLNITVQSGSEKVLNDMKRPVDIKELAEAMKKIRKEIPDLVVRTHYMVGFPGETEDDFNQTIKFMEETGIYKSLIFPFSPRPDTPAEKMENQIPEEEKQKRVKILEALRKTGSEKYYDGAIY